MPEPAQTTPEAPQSGAQPGVFNDPYRAYNFKLEIQGVVEGHFTEVIGIGARVQAIKYWEGGTNQQVHVIPGRVEYADIELRYGLTASRELFDWFMTAVNGQAERKNVAIIMVDSQGATEVMRWNLIDAWIREWRGAPLDAAKGQLALESVVLVYTQLQRA